MESPRFSSRELAFILGVPAAWGILLLFHPKGDGFYSVIEDNVTRWLTVHVGMAIFIPLFAGCVYLLLRGLDGTAATVSRIGLAVFAVLYAAYEITLGIGTGILTEQVNALAPADRGVGADLVESYAESPIIIVFTVLGSIGLLVGMIGAVVALRHAYGLSAAPSALMVVSIPLIAVHEPPFGPVGLAMFIAAVVLLVRQGRTASAPRTVPASHPGPA